MAPPSSPLQGARVLFAGRCRAPWGVATPLPDPDAQAVRALADDTRQDPRVRLPAFAWLRSNGHPVAPRQMLGVVLEVPVNGGLDVLAVYLDGSVRYLNHSARPTFIEGPLQTLQPAVSRVLQVSKSIVDCVRPADKERLPAPRTNVRLNFLVSDGLYVGEGPMDALSRDAMAGPLLQPGGELLQQLTELAVA